MSFAVVIPSKTKENLRACLSAVRRNEPDVEVIWVDDSDDDHLDTGWFFAAAQHPGTLKGACWLLGEKPFIFSRNVNMGIREALYPEDRSGVLILNDDALLKQVGGFSLLADTCYRHPEIGVIGCTTNLGHSCQKPKGVGLRIVDHFAFVAVYIPRRTIETVGFLDERFTAYGYEDNDYTIRVRAAGLKCAVHDGCYVDHGSLKSTFRGDPKTPAQLSEGRKIFLEKWPGAPV